MTRRLCLLLILIVSAVSCGIGDSGQKLTGGVPDFTLPAVDGSMVSMADYDGRVILVDFWATWCPPCKEMIPALSKLHKNYHDKGLVILGVSMGKEDLAVLGGFVHDNRIPYKILMGSSRISGAFGGISTIPTTYIVDRNGRLVRKLIGYHSYDELEKQVKRYL